MAVGSQWTQEPNELSTHPVYVQFSLCAHVIRQSQQVDRCLKSARKTLERCMKYLKN